MENHLQKKFRYLIAVVFLAFLVGSANAQFPLLPIPNPVPVPIPIPCCVHVPPGPTAVPPLVTPGIPQPTEPVQKLLTPLVPQPLNPSQQLHPGMTPTPVEPGIFAPPSISQPFALPSLPAPVDNLLIEIDKHIFQPIGRGIDHLGRQLDVIGRGKDAANELIQNAGGQADKTLAKTEDLLEKLVFKTIVGLFLLVTCGGGFLMLLHRLLSPTRRSLSA
jgi:hypothetical protein